MQPKPITDKLLSAWGTVDWGKAAGRWAGPVRQLIAEFTSLRFYVRFIEQAFLRERAQRVELDRQVKPSGRVLVVDCPAGPGERCEGETLVYFDGRIDLYTTRCPVGVNHPLFDEVLEAVLFEAPNRFKGMPGELSIRTRSLVRYVRDLPSEAAALVNAKYAAEVVAALNRLREDMASQGDGNEANGDQAKVGDQANANHSQELAPAQANATETKVQETKQIGTPAPAGAGGVPTNISHMLDLFTKAND